MLLAWSKFFPWALWHLVEEGQGKGLQAEILVTVAAEWQYSCPPFFSVLPEHSDPPVCRPSPQYHPPQSIKGSRKTAREEAGQVWRRTGEVHSRHGGRPHLLLLLHILAQIPCPEQRAPKRNASEVQTKNLLLCARLKKGRRVVVWLVLIRIFKLYVKLFCDGGKAEIVPR